jgi:hypothetical protein
VKPYGRDTRSFRERRLQFLKDEARKADRLSRQLDADGPHGGPPRKPDAIRRSELLATKVTRAEADAIRSFAAGRGGVSEWLRGIAIAEIGKGSV